MRHVAISFLFVICISKSNFIKCESSRQIFEVMFEVELQLIKSFSHCIIQFFFTHGYRSSRTLEQVAERLVTTLRMGDEIVLSWDIQSLTATTRVKHWFKQDQIKRKTLLKDVRGHVKSGCLLAIMGPSGAGKTTLLATLSQRSSGELLGDVMLNGRPVDKDLMVRVSGFVPQKDLAITCLTVLEHLNFMATLKLDRRVTEFQRQRIVVGLINTLNLSKATYTKISALSGGELKRLALATQMVTDPPLLFCDEPTTGLDSFNACSVVNVLRSLAARGKLVVCSIHQPASDVYTLFDQVSFLVPGGSQAYFGDIPGALNYFEKLGMPCPPLFNPADFLLSKLNSSHKITKDLCKKFKDSSLGEALENDLNNIKIASTNNQYVFGIEEMFLKFYAVQLPSQKIQLKLLMWRSAMAMLRDSQRIFLRFFMYMIVGLFVSSPFMSIKLDQAGIQSLQGFHYAIITETIFAHTYSVLHTFPAEISVMLREINNGVYQPGPYYFSKAIILIPRVMLETFMFCMIGFVLVGVEGGSLGFLTFSFPAVASAIVSTAYGCCMSAMFESVASASLLTVPLDFISYTFCGLFIHLSTVPFYLKWLKYISRFYYGIEAMSILQWRQVDTIACPESSDIPCITSGDGVLSKYGFSKHNLRLDFFGLLLTFAILHCVGFLALRKRSNRQSVY